MNLSSTIQITRQNGTVHTLLCYMHDYDYFISHTGIRAIRSIYAKWTVSTYSALFMLSAKVSVTCMQYELIQLICNANQFGSNHKSRRIGTSLIWRAQSRVRPQDFVHF